MFYQLNAIDSITAKLAFTLLFKTEKRILYSSLLQTLSLACFKAVNTEISYYLWNCAKHKNSFHSNLLILRFSQLLKMKTLCLFLCFKSVLETKCQLYR